MTPRDLTRYALAAAARGWHVFPLTPGDKVPLKGWPWKQRNTTDPEVIRRWWARARFNIGIACGPSRLVVVDLDRPKEGLRPPPPFDLPGINDGADVLAVLCEQAGQPLPFDTFTVTTRRGGLHLYFTAPEGSALGNTSGDKGNGLGWLIDTRAHGGYVVGPGSVVDLPDGTGPYEVIRPGEVAPLPRWLADRLTPRPLPPQRPVTVPLAATDRRTRYLRAALVSEIRRVTSSPPDGHNNALYVASVALGQLVAGGELSEADVAPLLADAAQQVGQPYGEAARTIASGLRAGARRPRTVAA